MTITPARWMSFLELVANTRQCQQIYRRTLDPMIRRESAKLEDLLDATITGIRLDLDPEDAVELLPAEAEVQPSAFSLQPSAAEGGAS